MLKKLLFAIFSFCLLINKCSGIWCYRCTSATPGCGNDFNWRGVGYLGDPCPEDKDVCVKVIEKRGAQEMITRDCLSSFQGFRTDVSADRYEGCRKAAQDVRLAHYVNHTIKENDVKRDYYPDVTFCFCFLDHRCNSAETMLPKMTIPLLSLLILYILRRLF